MKRYTHYFFIIGIVAALSTAFSSAAFAEGSNDLVNNEGNNGYRPYLEWRDRQNFGLQRKSVIYVYAEQGETIYFGSSVWRSSDKALRSVLSDNPNDVTGSIGQDMTGATIAITLPAEVGGMPYDLTGASISNLKWRSALDGGNITAGDKGIYLTRPDYAGGTYKGYIQNTSQEEIGPHIEGMDGTEGGYEPMSFTAPVTGTYAFRFLSSDYGEEDPEPIKVNETWITGKLPDGTDNELEQTNEKNATVAAWDITVVGEDNEKKTGRVWTNTLFLNTGAHETPLKSEIYTLTYDGFEYRVNLNGMEPFGFTLYSNNRGPLIDMYNMAQPDGNRPIGEDGKEVERSFDYLRSLTHSFYSYTEDNDVGPGPTRTEKDGNGNELFDSANKPVKSTIINNFDPVDPKRDHTHKLFFNQPSAEAVEAYTSQKKLVEETRDIVPPEMYPTVTYDGYGYAAGSDESGTSYGTWAIGGAFKIDLGADADFEHNTTDTYRIVLDFSEYALDKDNKPIIRNGLWAKRKDLTGGESTEQQENEKNNIVILVKVLETANEEILWDGQDAYGNNVPVGIYEGVGNTSWETGSAHFPLVDVERNPNGIIIERMNRIRDDEAANTDDARYTVYYNNEANGNDNTAWYYAGVTDGKYPTIGDGKNMLAGTSSKEGAMTYEGEGQGNGNYTVLDIWSRYIAPSTSGITIGVKRLPSQSSAMVSFVAAEGVTNDSTFKKSHVKQNGETLWETENRGDAYEEDIYGNTISTGFTATVNTSEIDNYGYNYITWDITIPMAGETYTYYDTSSGQAKPVTATAEPSYIKIPKEMSGVNAQNEEIIMSIAEMFGEGALDQEVSTGSEGEIEDLGSDPSYAEEEFDSGLTAVSLYDAEGNEQPYDNNKVWNVELKLDGTPVLKDEDSQVNKGDIYEITGIEAIGTQEYKKLKLQLAYELPATVSGGVSVTYGIIIDNLYAPSAVAEINYSQEKPGEEYDDLDSNNNAVHAGNLDGYDSESDYNYQ